MIFPNMHVERWAFDVECLYLAERQRIPMVEVPVTWHEVHPLEIPLIIGPRFKIVTCKGQFIDCIGLDSFSFELYPWPMENHRAKRRIEVCIGHTELRIGYQ
jgi:hypothetical protein